MLAASQTEIERRAGQLAACLASNGLASELLDGRSAIGGGSLPGETLPTRLLALRSDRSADRLAAQLRSLDPPIVGHIERDRLVLDLRTVLPEQDRLLAETLVDGLGRSAGGAANIPPPVVASLDDRPSQTTGG